MVRVFEQGGPLFRTVLVRSKYLFGLLFQKILLTGSLERTLSGPLEHTILVRSYGHSWVRFLVQFLVSGPLERTLLVRLSEPVWSAYLSRVQIGSLLWFCFSKISKIFLSVG